MKTSRAQRAVAVGSMVAVALLGSACDKVGPPIHDIGFEHTVQPQPSSTTATP